MEKLQQFWSVSGEWAWRSRGACCPAFSVPIRRGLSRQAEPSGGRGSVGRETMFHMRETLS